MTTDAASKAEMAAAKLKRAAQNFGEALFDALYPEQLSCDICLEDLQERGRYNLCAKCLEELPYVGDKICVNCGMPLEDEGEYCLRCQNNESAFKLCRAPFVYDGLARQMIYALKFSAKKYIVGTLGAFMADTFLERGMNAEIAVFVPMAQEEIKKRGFNQSELLARDVADRLNLPLLPALIKKKSTSEQKELTARERAANLEGVFECVFPQVKKRSVLLIDDVFTTGATSNECAKTLLKAGAREVSVLTAAITKQKISFEQDD